jgi:hypothetical protein
MSEIKRYRPIGTLPVRDDEHGGFVRHTDHLATINQAKMDALREFADSVCRREMSQFAQRLRDESDRHIQQLKEQP